MAVSKNQVGFECEFVEAPIEYLQSECPICLHILREPYQVTCCGKSFCRQCIERVKDDNKPCPCCNKDSFNDFPNKGLQQPLYGFKVYCTKKEKGCEWKGELGKLDEHLNMNSQDEKEFEGCELAEIMCRYCSDVIVRSKLLHHKNKFCDKRPFSCEYCNEYESTYDDVIHNHWPICSHHPVQCPNGCGAFPQRQNLDSHMQKECPLTVVECEFHCAGCEVKLPRRNMPDHLKDSIVTHLSQLAMSHRRQQEVYQEEIKALERRHHEETKIVKALTEEIDELKMQTERLRWEMHAPIVPTDFMVENPHASINWYSTPFYSHSQGYKLCLRLYDFCGYYIICLLMQGEFDSILNWPLKAMMKLKLCRHSQEDREFNLTLNIKKRLEDGVERQRCGSVPVGWNLSPYLCNNCLRIKIIGIDF